jgi:hypothetical protein
MKGAAASLLGRGAIFLCRRPLRGPCESHKRNDFTITSTRTWFQRCDVIVPPIGRSDFAAFDEKLVGPVFFAFHSTPHFNWLA